MGGMDVDALKVCLFLKKDSGEERKLRERNIFPCLEHYRKVKERKILGGPT